MMLFFLFKKLVYENQRTFNINQKINDLDPDKGTN
jgi:hypothetical protein